MLEAHNIHKTYNDGRNATAVLKGVTVKIDAGAFVGIVGPSGAGKSTLLHILGGLDQPTQGKVVFENKDLYKTSDKHISRLRNRKFGFVFQFYHLLPEFSVFENVMMPARITSGAWGQMRRAEGYARDLLSQAGLSARCAHFPNQLSGGEKQRVAIVRGLINSPDILFCDEPTGNLDSHTGEGIVDLIRSIQRAHKMAVILVTHNKELTRELDRVYQLKDGVLES